jgi:hypothetical protein
VGVGGSSVQFSSVQFSSVQFSSAAVTGGSRPDGDTGGRRAGRQHSRASSAEAVMMVMFFFFFFLASCDQDQSFWNQGYQIIRYRLSLRLSDLHLMIKTSNNRHH